MFVPQGTDIFSLRRGGDKHFSHTGGTGGQTFLHRGGANILLGGGDKIFTCGGGQTFYVRGGGAYDVDEEMVVSEVSKISAGAKGPEILVIYMVTSFLGSFSPLRLSSFLTLSLFLR